MKKSDMTAQPQIDLSKTVAINNASDGQIFQQGFILRKVSRFITGGEDAVLPIPVFYDGETGKIYSETLPPELRDEYDTF
ncbi:hypothetical protein [uncultured virus]|jgi:hypothetical protein|uniref:Uncharacterized protein n=1 Tax=uncultured virus TaxID=340016 RepID=A0A218MM86_9VIRU|nr:hypothetical protein [uncultured virus]